MNIRKLLIEAIEAGKAERDDAGNVSFELFGTKHSVRVTDADIEKRQATLDAELEQAEQDYAEAESTMVAAKKVIEKRKGRGKKKESK